MTTNDERIKILTMLQEGKIDAGEAARLLQVLDSTGESPSSADTPPAPKHKPRFLHVRVSKVADGKKMVDIKVPISIVNAGIRMGAKFSPEMFGLDKDMLAALFESPDSSQIIDVIDEDGEHVEIFFE